MITLSFLVVGLCFFLHRKFKKEHGTVSLHTLPWTDENLEVFTLSGQVCEVCDRVDMYDKCDKRLRSIDLGFIGLVHFSRFSTFLKYPKLIRG